MIVAQTYKGKHMPEQENMDNWHGKPMKKDTFEKIKVSEGVKIDSRAFVNLVVRIKGGFHCST